MRVEIRCCCDAGKLLGWVELAGLQQIKEGDNFTFRLQSEQDLSPYAEAALAPSSLAERLTLPVGYWWHNRLEVRDDGGHVVRDSGLAIKSNDTPIEKLRRIAGFQEAQ